MARWVKKYGKRCTICQQWLESHHFWKFIWHMDGLFSSCRECTCKIRNEQDKVRKARGELHRPSKTREYQRQYMRAYRERNREKINTYTREWQRARRANYLASIRKTPWLTDS
jgi:hypothetical protein